MTEEAHIAERNTGYLKPFRLSFTDDEKIYDWLSPLLDALRLLIKRRSLLA